MSQNIANGEVTSLILSFQPFEPIDKPLFIQHAVAHLSAVEDCISSVKTAQVGLTLSSLKNYLRWLSSPLTSAKTKEHQLVE